MTKPVQKTSHYVIELLHPSGMRLATLGPFPFQNGLCSRYLTASVDELVKNNATESALFDFLSHLGRSPQSFLCHDRPEQDRAIDGPDGNSYTAISYTWVPWEPPAERPGLPPGIIFTN